MPVRGSGRADPGRRDPRDAGVPGTPGGSAGSGVGGTGGGGPCGRDTEERTRRTGEQGGDQGARDTAERTRRTGEQGDGQGGRDTSCGGPRGQKNCLVQNLYVHYCFFYRLLFYGLRTDSYWT